MEGGRVTQGRKSQQLTFSSFLPARNRASLNLPGRIPQSPCHLDRRGSPTSTSDAIKQVEILIDILVLVHILSVSQHLLEMEVQVQQSCCLPGVILPPPPPRAFDNVYRPVLSQLEEGGVSSATRFQQIKARDAAKYLTVTKQSVPHNKEFIWSKMSRVSKLGNWTLAHHSDFIWSMQCCDLLPTGRMLMLPGCRIPTEECL